MQEKHSSGRKRVNMKSKRYARVDQKRCVSCGACARECPKAAIFVWKGCYAKTDQDKCVGCGKCAKACPADCITIEEREER